MNKLDATKVIDITKYHNRGYTGLSNLGNTCFLNSCLQILSHTYELNAILDSPNIKKCMKTTTSDAIIINEWNNLRDIMWNNNGVVSPNRFVHHVQQVAIEKDRELFTGWAQNDLSEFLLFIIQCMHNSISRGMNMRILGNVENSTDKMAIECYNMLKQVYSKEYSEIMDLYYAIYVSEISDKTSDIIHSIKPECYFMLDLPIPDNRRCTLYDCFNEFTKYEILDGDNAWYNDTTGQKEAVKKRFTFWNFPTILVVSLKRFSPCGERKLNNLVGFPINDLDLTPYVSGYNPQHYRYKLFGICNHIGGVQGGHYTAFVKNAENKWLEFNDEHVTEISESKIVSPSAYCLFYRRIQ